MFMPVESLIRLKQSVIYDASPRQRRLIIPMTHWRLDFRLGGRGAKFVGLLLWCIAMGGLYPPDTHGAVEEKQPLKLPEVVILGQDVSVLKETKERLVPQELAPTLKEIPAEAREKINLAALEQGSKSTPQVSSPGCLFGNPVTGSIARAFLGDEAQYKVGLYRYQNGDYPGGYRCLQSCPSRLSAEPLPGLGLLLGGGELLPLGAV